MRGSPVNKAAVRITLKIPPENQNSLESWREIIRRFGVESRWAHALNVVGGWGEADWWIYWGTISPDWFTRVDFLDGHPPE
jgi:hypothetical protein